MFERPSLEIVLTLAMLVLYWLGVACGSLQLSGLVSMR